VDNWHRFLCGLDALPIASGVKALKRTSPQSQPANDHALALFFLHLLTAEESYVLYASGL